MLTLIFFTLALLLLASNIFFAFFSNKKAQLLMDIALLLLLAATSLLMYYFKVDKTYFAIIRADPFSFFFSFLFSVAFILIALLAYSYAPDFSYFSILSSFAIFGMFTVVFAGYLLLILIGLELATLPSVFIVLLSRRNSMEAAVKFLIMSIFVASLLSFAIVLVYGSTGSVLLTNLSKIGYAVIALIFFVASLGFDASQFPFNVLIPDIYQGSSSYATAMLGGINKKLGFAALMQVLIVLFIGLNLAFEIAAILSVFTMFYGNLVALMQKNLKRLFAYSSISQAGYIMIGIATATASGIEASLMQIFAHMFLFIGALAIIAWLEKMQRQNIDDLIGLSSENKLAALAFTIFMLSMVGLPFTTGFVGKFFLFLSAATSGLAWLAILGIVNSVISIFYYAKPITAIFTNKYESKKLSIDHATLVVIMFCLILTVLFGIFPQPILSFAKSASLYLFKYSA